MLISILTIPSTKDQVENSSPASWNQASWKLFYDEYRAFVFRIACRFVNHGPHVDDLVQDVFLFAYQRAHEIPYPQYTKTWLYRVTRFMCLDHIKRDKVQQRLVDGAQDARIGHRVERSGERLVQRELIYKCLQELNQKQREAIILCDLEGMRSHEAGEMIGLSPSTFRTHLMKARKNFRQHLEKISEQNHAR